MKAGCGVPAANIDDVVPKAGTGDGEALPNSGAACGMFGEREL